MKKQIMFLGFLLIGAVNLLATADAAIISVCGMPSGATVQIQVTDVTTPASPAVLQAWTATGVTEIANGQGKSCYLYDIAQTAGHCYQIDWQDDSSPIKTAAEMECVAATVILPVMQGAVYTATAAQSRIVSIVRGDTPRITFDLGADYTGWTASFAAKTKPADITYVISSRAATWTSAALGQGYIDLTATDTAATGVLAAEIELTNGAQHLTGMKFTLKIIEDVIK